VKASLYEAIRARRVTRSMTLETIDQTTLDMWMRSSQFAPNAGNRRLQVVVPVVDSRMLGLLRAVSPGMLPRPVAAAVICIDTLRAVNFGFQRDAPGLFIDVGTIAATMLLAAEALGLGACPVTSFSRAAVTRLLSLENGLEPRLIVCAGYRAADQPPPMEAGGGVIAS
jgi:nitroreductase